MSRTRLLFIICYLLFSYVSSSQTEKEAYETAIFRAERFYNNNVYDSALAYYLNAVKITRQYKENPYFLALSQVVMLNTGGKQRPVSRSENIGFNWIIW